MELNLTASNYTLRSSNDIEKTGIIEGLRSAPPEIQFVGRAADKVVFTMLAEPGISAARWNKLADACAHGSAAGKDWAPHNGKICISIADGLTEFTVASHGGSCGGSASIFISARCCIGAFREAARLTEAWVDGR